MLSDDPALLAAFLDESQESLAGLEARLVDLDGAADLRAEVDAMFRPVHTLKGNAPFFGFMHLQRLAHALETILDRLRKGVMARSPTVTDALLAGLDGLRAGIERLRAGGPEVTDVAAFAVLVDRLVVLGDQDSAVDLWARILSDVTDIERQADQFDPATLAKIARVRQDLATLRSRQPSQPASSQADHLTHTIRQRLARTFDVPLDAAIADTVMADLRALRAFCTDQAQTMLLDDTVATCQVLVSSVGFDEMVRRHVLERLDQLTTFPTVATTAPEPAAPRIGDSSSERRVRSDSEIHGKSMRVSEAAVDGFLAHVGEMLVIGDQLEHLQRRMSTSLAQQDLARDMRQVVASFGVLSTDLQRSIMAVRRVSVRSLLQKAPRLVRDIANHAGKDIAVVVQGEATEVDKGRLDLLDGPLTHLVRNCADHGIELPDVRVAAGKPARGTITLTAGSEDGWFTLQIADDGKGLDLEAIRRKGEALGLIRPGVPLEEQMVIDLIFASGLSTATTVSNVSGRGVGMDVVKRQIVESGGTVTVTTTRGQGTTFQLRLPSAVSTQIIQAFLVQDGAGFFALPLEMVRESFVDAEARTVDGIGVVMRHGSVVPVAPLGGILGQPIATRTHERHRTFVTVERNGATIAVSVDATLGVRRLVIRSLRGSSDSDLDGRFQGAALLGDGRLALVVDPDSLLRLINHEEAPV